MSFLFGHLYDSPCKFTHDQAMFRKTGKDKGISLGSKPATPEAPSIEPARKDVNPEKAARSSSSEASMHKSLDATTSHTHLPGHEEPADDPARLNAATPMALTADHATRKRRRSDESETNEPATPSIHAERSAVNISACPPSDSPISRAVPHVDPPSLSPYEYSEAWKQQAFEAASGTGSTDWNDITLVSISGHQEREEEL
jgi:hypothetical protein